MEKIKILIEKGIDKLPQCRLVREEVFIKEQKFEKEFDDIDAYAYHELIYTDDKPVAVCRFFTDDKTEKIYHLGRVCVLKEYRGKSLGKALLENTEMFLKLKGAEEIHLSAQVRAKDFYVKLGYTEYGEEFLDEYCPHINMKKKL